MMNSAVRDRMYTAHRIQTKGLKRCVQFRRFKTTYIIIFLKTLTQETEYKSEDHLQKFYAWYCFGDDTN